MLNKKLSALLIVFVIMFGFIFHYQLISVLSQTGLFNVKKVVMNGVSIAKDLTFDQIIRQTTNTYSLTTLNSFLLKDQLESLELIKTATIKKDFPFTLTIDIEERIPVARIEISSNIYMLDKEGVILQYEYTNFVPVIKAQFGVGIDDKVIADPLLKQILWNISSLNITEIDTITVDKNREIYFKLKEFTPQFYIKNNILTDKYLQRALKIKNNIVSDESSKRIPSTIDIHSYEDTFIGFYKK